MRIFLFSFCIKVKALNSSNSIIISLQILFFFHPDSEIHALGVMGRLGICPCVATAGSCSHVMVTRRCEMSSEQNKSVTAGRRGTRDMFRRGLSLGASHAQRRCDQLWK